MVETALIIGIDSLVGSAFGAAVKQIGWPVIGTTRRQGSNFVQLDVSSNIDIWPELPKCDLLLVCASINELGACQQNSSLSRSVNVKGLEKAIKKYKGEKTKVMFLSSSHVFDGNKSFYKEDDIRNPKNVLGEHKECGEKLVLEEGGLVVRVTKVIGPYFPRFMEWAGKLRSGQNVQALDNLGASLVPLDSLVAVLTVAAQKQWDGIVHVSGPTENSYSEIATMLARSLGCSEDLVIAVKADSETLKRAQLHTTLGVSERIRVLNVDLPCTDVVVDQWCKNYIHEK